jgi:hypothetical protein
VCTLSQYRTKLLLLSHNFSNVMINNTSTDEAHYEFVVMELVADRQGLTALWFKIVRSFVMTGMYEIEAPRRKYPKVGAALGVALCLPN